MLKLGLKRLPRPKRASVAEVALQSFGVAGLLLGLWALTGDPVVPLVVASALALLLGLALSRLV